MKVHNQKEESGKTALKTTKKNAGSMLIFLKTPLSLRALFQPIASSKDKIKSIIVEKIG
jgi:hypothetical protein